MLAYRTTSTGEEWAQRMSKILTVADDLVTIGCDDGTLKDVRPCDLNFDPAVGDEVEIFESNSRVLVSKKEHQAIQRPEEPAQQGGDGSTSIPVDNSNNSTSAAVDANPAAGGKVVNRLAYVLLAILLGGVGAQFFYVGKTSIGIVCVVFCWTGIPSLIGLVQGIIALTKPEDATGNIVVS